MTRLNICSSAILIASLMAGCATTSGPKDEDAKAAKAAVVVDTALSKYAKSATEAMQMLASVQMAAEDVKTQEAGVTAAPVGLDLVYKHRDWLDDIEMIVQTIATDTGWSYLPPIGRKTTSIVVGINALDKSAYDVLREVGIKAGRSATIMVNVKTRELLIRYPDRLSQPSDIPAQGAK